MLADYHILCNLSTFFLFLLTFLRDVLTFVHIPEFSDHRFRLRCWMAEEIYPGKNGSIYLNAIAVGITFLECF